MESYNKTVTYLLGAGASYNALPVVDEMPKFFNAFLDYIEVFKQKLELSETHSMILLNNFNSIIKSASAHQSVDTYAKKLYLRGEGMKLIDLKYFLSAFFLWMESDLTDFLDYIQNKRRDSMQINRFNDLQIKERQKIDAKLETRIDLRYDSFFATLLEKEGENSIKLPDNINIISWNYDTQLERAFSEYISMDHFDILSCAKKLRMFPKPISHNPSNTIVQIKNVSKELEPYNEPLENYRIIKLNGTAGDFFSTEASLLNSIHEIGKTDFEILKSLLVRIAKEYETPTAVPKVIPYLNFAWEYEQNQFSKNAIESAKRLISKTNILVIVGYSFPNFNREIDKKILGQLPDNLEKIYYQAPTNDVELLIERLKGVMRNARPHKPAFEPIPYDKDLKQFLIPLEI